MKKLLFETEPCGRCQGTGWYSYCQMWGNTCFECGVRPHEQGTGRRFTKAAKQAQAAIQVLLDANFKRRADAVEPGMWFSPYGGLPKCVLAVKNPSGSGVVRPDGTVAYGVDLVAKDCTHVYQPENLIAVVPTVSEWEAVIVPFARTLAGVTVEGDTPVGVYRLVVGREGRRVDYIGRAGSVDVALARIKEAGPRAQRRMFIAPIEHDAGRAKSWAAVA